MKVAFVLLGLKLISLRLTIPYFFFCVKPASCGGDNLSHSTIELSFHFVQNKLERIITFAISFSDIVGLSRIAWGTDFSAGSCQYIPFAISR